MAAAVVSNHEKVLQRFYARGLKHIARPECVFCREVPKNQSYRGQVRSALVIGDGGGSSRQLSVAQSAHTAAKLEAFTFTEQDLAKEYSVVEVDNLAQHWADGKGALVPLLTQQINSKIRNVVRSYQLGAYATTQYRIMGTVSSSPSGAWFKLSNAFEARRFRIGDRIEAAATALAARVGPVAGAQVCAVNAGAAKIKVNATAAVVLTGLANGYKVFRAGDAPNGVTAGAAPAGYRGLPQWLAGGDATSTLWFGVNRTQDTEKLAGHKVNLSSEGTMEGAIIQLASVLHDRTQGEAKPDRVYVPVDKFARLIRELQSKDRYSGQQEDVKFGYSYIKSLFGPYSLRIVPDPALQLNSMFMLTMPTWENISVRSVPHFDMDDGNRMLRKSDADSTEIRIKAYSQFFCHIPYHNAQGTNLPG